MHKKLEVWCKNGGSSGSWGAFDGLLKKMGEDGVKFGFTPLLFMFFVRLRLPRRVGFFFLQSSIFHCYYIYFPLKPYNYIQT